ncbi:unnamed protein product [Eruca vesicaria subsp. sativa]|uniref:Uncharacterized protein n=1 Tax=Eruca vesicaria subsp. sativa TaxID=29727 RepID=A0ABC8JDM1_ERUVS|nr:unnamed protein product [Eruca vesicaria subsp. sativa]
MRSNGMIYEVAYIEGYGNMGRYSYSQPSSSDGCDDIQTRLLEEEAALYAEEAARCHTIADPVQYHSQPEGDEGIPNSWWDVAVM